MGRFYGQVQMLLGELKKEKEALKAEKEAVVAEKGGLQHQLEEAHYKAEAKAAVGA